MKKKLESCQLITVLSSLSDHSLAQCRSGGARLPVQVVGLDIWTTTESAEVGFPVRTDWIILPWLRPRLDPKFFGFWLTVAFRLYLVISV